MNLLFKLDQTYCFWLHLSSQELGWRVSCPCDWGGDSGWLWAYSFLYWSWETSNLDNHWSLSEYFHMFCRKETIQMLILKGLIDTNYMVQAFCLSYTHLGGLSFHSTVFTLESCMEIPFRFPLLLLLLLFFNPFIHHESVHVIIFSQGVIRDTVINRNHSYCEPYKYYMPYSYMLC